jgi:NAD(P)-dependent dehydrogenase (short-subunit alcohol dehydrogenase family)
MTDFRDKTAIVTGGASGIGRALCRELARRGAMVTVADINGAGAQEVAASITAQGGRAVAAQVDVANEREVVDLVNAAGRLDYMFNNAGVCIQGEMRDMTMEMWRRIVGVNQWGVIHGAMAAYAVMRRQGFGHLVNTASAAGLIPIPTQSAYTMTKHAIVGMSLALRMEAAALGVRVSVVCPGLVDTNMIRTTPVLRARMEDIEPRIPLRMFSAEAMAAAVLRGVSANRAIIIAPASARLLWWIYRLSPGLMERTLGRKVVSSFRAVRKED